MPNDQVEGWTTDICTSCVRLECLATGTFHADVTSAVQALSQYYLLLLFPSKVQCINRINGQVKQELAIPPSRTLQAGPQNLALASDAAEGTLYLMSGVIDCLPLACVLCMLIASMHLLAVAPL